MQFQVATAPETCFERTRAGQCEILTQNAALGALDRRLLALVNGYTPLGDLLALLGESEVPQQTVMALLKAGLIRRAPTAPKKPAFPGVDFKSGNLEWFGAH
jgi:hypothetical protein